MKLRTDNYRLFVLLRISLEYKQERFFNQLVQKGVQKMTVTKLIMQAQLVDCSVVEVVTPEEASKEFDKCLKTIYNWIYGEKVKTVKGNKQVLIVKDSLLSFLASKKTKKQL